MKNTFKKIFTVRFLNLFMVMFIGILVAYPLFAPIVPAEYGKPEVLNAQTLRAGKELTYKLHSCRYVNEGVLTTVTRQLVDVKNKDKLPINLESDTFTNKAKCSDVTRTVFIPYSIPEGEYQLVVKGVYSVIPLRSPITISATSDSFIVKGASLNEDIEALIKANTELQAQIREQLKAQGATPSATSQPTQQPSSPSAPDKPVQGSGSNNGDNGFPSGLFKALGGGDIKVSL